MAKRPELMVQTGELSGSRYSVPEGGLRLGRSSSNDLHVPDEELSRNHCMFEQDGADGIRIIDLASANGTFVNGDQLGSDPRVLAVGDVIEVGSTRLVVVAEGEAPAAVPTPRPPAGGAVDLGLGTAELAPGAPSASAPAPARRSPVANLIWVVVAAVVVAIAVVLCLPSGSGSRQPRAASAEPAKPALTSIRYEKVDADAKRIFRFVMTVEDGVLHVVYDDVPGENRHVDKSVKLSEQAAKRIEEIFATEGWEALDDTYAGSSASDENALKSWRIRTVVGRRVREILVENASEPEAFQAVREALETFSQNELGIWAVQHSREELLALSKTAEEVGDAKWDERDVEYGNVGGAVKSYREAVFYLETVSPKPEGYAALKDKLATAESDLDRRYKDQRFLADKALNLSDWETAGRELRVLCQIISDKNDERYIEANAKLVDVENRIARSTKKGGK